MKPSQIASEEASHKAAGIKVTVEYIDGLTGIFSKQPDGSWVQTVRGLRVTGYDPPNVMRVLGNAIGTREVAE